MKRATITIFALIFGISYCMSQNTSAVDVYVAGKVGARAVVWKNGAAQYLTDGARKAIARSVFLSDGDVYVAGWELNQQNNSIAKLWKNGVMQNLATGRMDNQQALSVYVSDGNVYVAGMEYSDGGEEADGLCAARLWKNGILQELEYISEWEWVSSVFVSGGDVYVTGTSTWKNGEPMYDFGGNSIFVSGGVVYITGGNTWKNGEAMNVFDGNSVYVSGSDVYVARYEYNTQGMAIAKLWKNGMSQNLTDGTREASANSVYVSGNDAYVAGYEQNPQGNKVARLWKNGVAQNLTDGSKDAEARSVFVVSAGSAVASSDNYIPPPNENIAPIENTTNPAKPNEPALLHIYRKRASIVNVLSVPLTRYDILMDNMVVGSRTSNNWKTTITVPTFGVKTLSATIDGRKGEVQITIEPGGVYYVSGDVSSIRRELGKTSKDGKPVMETLYTPTFQLVDKRTGETEFNAIVVK